MAALQSATRPTKAATPNTTRPDCRSIDMAVNAPSSTSPPPPPPPAPPPAAAPAAAVRAGEVLTAASAHLLSTVVRRLASELPAYNWPLSAIELHCSHSMPSRVCETVERPSVRQSVCLSRHSTVSAAAAACGEFAAERRAGTGRHRRPQHGAAARRSAANASSVTFTADV